MKSLAQIHRWCGGLIGLLLAALGATGVLLLYKTSWIGLAGAGDPATNDIATLARQAAILAQRDDAQSIVFARDDFGLARLNFADKQGAYLNQDGALVAQWDSVWARPELWLFDFHHHLLAGETGDLVLGVTGLVGLGFVLSGMLLWWQTRRTFAPRPWPRRMTRAAIVRQHRDIGIVVAPVLALLMLTGAMMSMRPFADLVLRPWSSAAEMRAAAKPPELPARDLSPDLDWPAMIAAAKARFPDAVVRAVSLPKSPGEPIAVRLRLPSEWHPNGRTLVWFDPADGRMVASRSAETLPPGTRINNLVYPVHAGAVGGLTYKLVLTVTGLALVLLGTLAVWSFWFRQPRATPRPLALEQPLGQPA